MLLEMLVQAIMILVNRKGDCAKFQDGAKKLMNKILVSKIDATIIHSRKGKVHSQVVERFLGNVMTMKSKYRCFNGSVYFQPNIAVRYYAYRVISVIPVYVMYYLCIFTCFFFVKDTKISLQNLICFAIL